MKINKINSESIDSLRVICCFIVIVSHLYELKTGILDNAYNEIISFIAVAVFFYISGYVNYISYNSKRDPLIFYNARIKRLMPNYLIAIAISIILSVYFSSFKNEYLLNIAFMQSWAVETINTNPALWSLAYEIFLYLVFPAFFVVRNKLFWAFLSIFILVIVFHKINALILLFCFVAGVFKATREKEFLYINFFPKIGKWTYEIYIFHFPILFLLFKSWSIS